MPQALIITVGGSDEPLVSLIKSYKDKIDFIYFICSGGKGPSASSKIVDGEGDVIPGKPREKCPKCGEVIQEKTKGRPNILIQSGYKGKYQKIEIDNPDNFQGVYEKTVNVINEAKREGYEITADFTGGTKTMSSVLAMLSALDFEIKPSLTIGPRRDVIKVVGESVPVVLDVDLARLEFALKTVDTLISRYLYYPASLILGELLRKELKQELVERITKKWRLCKAFAYWDGFEYQEAYKNLKDYPNEYNKEFKFLLKLLQMEKNTGYEKIFDLISNAERQAYNGYYDNAVARLYRALELLAQVRLKTKYQIDTSNLDLDKLKNPEKWEQLKDEKGRIRFGLKNAYELLFEEFKDEAGKIYKEERSRLMNNLETRNNSKLAHGDKPVTENEWKEFIGFSKVFIESCCRKWNLKPEYIEFPTQLNLIKFAL